MTNLSIGQRVGPGGRYLIEALIAAGCTTTVYRVRDQDLHRTAVLKVIRDEFVNDDETRSSFHRLVSQLVRLHHSAIAPVFYAGHDPTTGYFLVTPYYPLRSLARRLETGRVAPKWALRVLGEIAGALDYAHDAGIVHGGIKPDNVLLDENDRALLADFGMLHVGDRSNLMRAETTTECADTLRYMAPEILLAVASGEFASNKRPISE